jgi:hypothetical protein
MSNLLGRSGYGAKSRSPESAPPRLTVPFGKGSGLDGQVTLRDLGRDMSRAVQRKAGDGIQTAHRPGALDGVEGAEEVVDRFFASLPLAERQSRLLNRSQKLVGFLGECLDRVISHWS